MRAIKEAVVENQAGIDCLALKILPVDWSLR